jgi:hypothetical protein
VVGADGAGVWTAVWACVCAWAFDGEGSGALAATRSTLFGDSGLWTEFVIRRPPPNPTAIATNTVPMPAKKEDGLNAIEDLHVRPTTPDPNETFHDKFVFRHALVPLWRWNISRAKNFPSHRFIMEEIEMKYALVIAALAGISFAMPASAEEVGVGVGVGPAGAGVTVGAGRSDYDRDHRDHTTTIVKEREPERDKTVIIKKDREPEDRKVIIDRN